MRAPIAGATEWPLVCGCLQAFTVPNLGVSLSGTAGRVSGRHLHTGAGRLLLHRHRRGRRRRHRRRRTPRAYISAARHMRTEARHWILMSRGTFLARSWRSRCVRRSLCHVLYDLFVTCRLGAASVSMKRYAEVLNPHVYSCRPRCRLCRRCQARISLVPASDIRRVCICRTKY